MGYRQNRSFWIADREDTPEAADQKRRSMEVWENAMAAAERFYFQLKSLGNTPEKCRTVLPTSTKSAIRITANIREWRHILNLRAPAGKSTSVVFKKSMACAVVCVIPCPFSNWSPGHPPGLIKIYY